ncbi:MAG: putative manganese-dependent inorganic diphosphatase [Thermoleophilia bacterium]|nr:putative manganese-dependent inorganic diphosphatase [Thermoleophilia bacterium]
MSTIYVTGHRNPDMDSIAAAIGYAELKQRLNPDDTYVPVRLGVVNTQTDWALEKSGAPEPMLLDHIMLRARDVMRPLREAATVDDSLREVGLAMSRAQTDIIPILDDGRIVGMVTSRDLARRYVHESREPSSFQDRPVSVNLIAEALEGEVLVEPERRLDGRLWAVTVDVATMGSTMGAHDIVVIGDREDAQARAAELGVGMMLATYSARPSDETLELCRRNGVGVVLSPLDSYTSGRLASQAVAAREVMSRDPLTAEPDDLISEIADRVKDVYYSACIIVDDENRPVGVVTRTNLVNPEPRRVLLVDHAEQAQSVRGVEQANIVEILDHHHIGSIETKLPVAATFDPVGSTATLVVERFRANGREPKPSTAMMLLAAVLSDTVILSSPTTTDRDRRVVEYLEELLTLDAREFGREMFEASSRVGGVPATEIIRRDAKEYEVSGGDTICIAQIEVVGQPLNARLSELYEALEQARTSHGYAIYALMVTDIVDKSTQLVVAGELASVERAFGVEPEGRVFALPGVMSRKKQVAPKLLAAL